MAVISKAVGKLGLLGGVRLEGERKEGHEALGARPSLGPLMAVISKAVKITTRQPITLYQRNEIPVNK